MGTTTRLRLIMPVLIDQIRRRKDEFCCRLSARITVGAVPPGHDTPCRFYGGTSWQGYPNITFHRPGTANDNWIVHAHRLFWVLANHREIPEGMQPDHTCRHRACVAHLQLVTKANNVSARYKRGYCGKCKRYGCEHKPGQ